jgi:ABC-2 type transport system permease protein
MSGAKSSTGFASRLSAGLKLYARLISASIRSKMQYKLDFIGATLIQATMSMYDFLFVAAILWRFRFIHGWSIYEVGLLYAISTIGWGVYRVFCNELETFEIYIVSGAYDSVLIRPWPALLVLLSRNLDLSRVTWVIQGLAVGAICVPPLMRSGALTWFGLAQVLLACLWSTLICAAVGLATAAAAFWIVRIEELQVFTQNAPRTAALYPLEIYPQWLRTALLTVIPFAVGNYLPVVYILGKGGTWMNLIWPAAASAASLYAANALWHAGEARYHSTGS